MSMAKEDWIGCRFDIKVEAFDYVEEYLIQCIGPKNKYLISHEVAKNPHFHILFEGDIKMYKNFSQQMKRKYKLNMNGKKSQYRKDKEIRSLRQYQTYCTKDSNYRSNMCPEFIKELYSESYQKEQLNPINEEIIKELLEEDHEHPKWANKFSKYIERETVGDFQSRVQIIIINKLLKKKSTINKCRVKKIYTQYLVAHKDEACTDSMNHAELIYFNIMR